ncbi:MAG: integrase [Flavobacterium sp. BFFFF2]|nr:MAG: integrase [Flavobacterium sp. BFFFF2]
METLAAYLLRHYTKKTAIAYQREIEIYINNNPKSKRYTYAEIVDYIGLLRTKYTNAKTIKRILASIKAYYSYLCFIELRKDNPSKSIKLRDKQTRDIQLQDLFTTEELETLLTAKQERYTNLDYRNKVLMSLLIYQGLKPNEIAALQCDELNLEQATIYIKSSAKSNSRTLALRANQILLFKKYTEEIRPKLIQDNQTKAFVIGQRKQPMSAEDITKHITRNYDIYPPRKVNALTIRQSVITNLLKQHHDLRIVQSFAGHKYPSTTERYKQTQVEALQEALGLYHPIR